jgi:hypothetical protein
MTDDPSTEGRAFAEFLRGLTPAQRNEGNKRQIEQAKAEYEEFKQAFREGHCSICKCELASFDQKRPCLHWLLRPVGFTKWHFINVANEFRFFQMHSYLRWVANEEVFGQNINDLRCEGTGKLIELTIRYKVYEWAFSCGDADFSGHETNSPESRKPHYHFQMRVNRAAFIRYNDFHVPFHRMDIVELEAMRQAPDTIKLSFLGGEGMSDVLNEETLEAVVRREMVAGDPDEAAFKLDSIITAEEGTTISGDDVAALIDEAKKTGVTIASLLHKLPNARVQTIVTPGPGVVEQAQRSGRNRPKP